MLHKFSVCTPEITQNISYMGTLIISVVYTVCHHSSETLDHLLSSCEVLAKSEYINRHNTVAISTSIRTSVVLPILSAPVFGGTSVLDSE